MVNTVGSSLNGMRRIGFNGVLFAAPVAGVAVLSLAYGNFAPLLDPFPWPKVLTFAIGVVLLAASIGLLFESALAASSITIAVCATAWALARTSPIFQAPQSIGSWYGFCEAVSMLVGVWTLYALHRRHSHAGRVAPLTGDIALRVARCLFGAACLVYGIAHFAYAAYSLPFVPTWLPARVPLLYATGVFHAAAGAGLILGILPRLAARLEATMIISFGVLVWIPSYFANPTPKWAGNLQNQWSETIVTFLLAGVAWLIADSLRSDVSTKKWAKWPLSTNTG
jgi:uncharacterized membrane protein YphA (DoxX/SURF4 family)